MWNLPGAPRRVRSSTTVAVDDSVAGVYWVFSAALAIWGWIELAFLTGIITGPNQPLPEGHSEWGRFIRAWGTVAYHEMLLAGSPDRLSWPAPAAENTFGRLDLWRAFARGFQAKLNLYLGVRKINTEFIPNPLAICPATSASRG
jgi:putative photosynthetic complex assembly protein 2